MKRYPNGTGIVRIRNNDGCNFDPESLIKSLEKQYNIDIRKLPQWKEIVQRLHTTKTDLNRKILDVELRKKIIIEKIYTQETRQSPFELTSFLARTAKKWEALETKQRKLEVPRILSSEEIPCIDDDTEPELSSKYMTVTRHPNSEVVLSEDIFHEKPTAMVDVESIAEGLSHMPLFFSTNLHKCISPLDSKDGAISYHSKLDIYQSEPESKVKEWMSLKQTLFLSSVPKTITITNCTLTEQHLKFSITNCYAKSFNLRFKCITDVTHFKMVKVNPERSLKLYPGITVTFIFIFKLKDSNDEFTSNVYFKVGHDFRESPIESFLVPIVKRNMGVRAVNVSEVVRFAPKYSWHINKRCGFPTSTIKVEVNDNHNYHLSITKRIVDFMRDSVSSSGMAMAPNTESLMEREIEDEIKSDEFSLKSQLPTDTKESESLKTIIYIGFIVDEIVDLSLEKFILAKTFLDLCPHSKEKISVYFTKAEHIGYHQSYYDFNFCDPVTEKIVITKTVLLLSEVLPHPVQIMPKLLDMSQSPINYGFCEDRITIYNTHKVYNVMVKFNMTKKMQKLFQISPLEGSIQPKSKSDFIVRMCSRELSSNKKFEDLAHFTIKITFMGHDSIYFNIPPLYYEIIAPCAFELKNIYKVH